jgi:hypothetical protein
LHQLTPFAVIWSAAMTDASPGRTRRVLAGSLLLLALAMPPARAADKPDCEAAGLALWGDGKHDDTKALNAWFKGDRVVWAQTGRAIGPEIAGHDFLLSSTVFIPSGTGLRFERFQMVWPARKERVAGGTILTGNDPDKPATQVGIVKIGAGPDEGVPYDAPPPKPGTRDIPESCLVS